MFGVAVTSGADWYMQALLDLDNSTASSTEQLPEQEAQQERWQQVGSLLGRKHDRIDATQALPLLPPQVHNSSAQPSLTCSVPGCLHL